MNQADKNDSIQLQYFSNKSPWLEYVIEDVLPLSTVESPAFRKLIGGMTSAQVPDRKSFTLHLDKAFDEMEKKIKATLEGIDLVSTTACRCMVGTQLQLFWNDRALD